MYSRELPPFGISDDYARDLRRITLAGQTRDGSLEMRAYLKGIIENAASHRIKHGYALWALDQIEGNHATRPRNEFHVDTRHKQASDVNKGSQELPFKTIQKAALVARAGDSVIVHEGEYRECVSPCCSGVSAQLPIVYRAALGEKVTIKASDLINSPWTAHGDGCYSTPYTPLPWDTPELGSENHPTSRCEQVFAEGVLLQHVATQELLRKTSGSMWIDDERGVIVVHCKSELDPATIVMERSVRPQCLVPLVRGIDHIHILGFTMIGGASFQWTGGNWHHIDQMATVSVDGGRYWLIEGNTIEWGNAQGLNIGVGGFSDPRGPVPLVHAPVERMDMLFSERYKGMGGNNSARNNIVRYHGIAGIVAINGTHNLVIEGNDVSYNCQKNNAGTCEEAGIKIHWMCDGILRNNTVCDNDAYGIWLDAGCERNRITGNLLINNNNHAIFHEISEGPLLVDNNVIIDTRKDPASCGFYTHDGNHATIINNVIMGPHLGVRVRALFHRKWGDRYTTTNSNHFYNNIIDNCSQGCISLMPEVPRCEDNVSDCNVFWFNGKPPFVRIENTSDVGLVWENSTLGKALGFVGGGDKEIRLSDWARYEGKDTHSLELPAFQILGTKDPEQMRAKLLAAWKRLGCDDAQGYFDAKPFLVSDWLTALEPKLAGCALVRTVFTGPACGFAVWTTPQGHAIIRWNGDSMGPLESDVPLPLASEIVKSDVIIPTLASGETVVIPVARGTAIIESCLSASSAQGKLTIALDASAAAGEYGIVFGKQGQAQEARFQIAPACTLDDCTAIREGGNAIVTSLSNNSSQARTGTVSVALGGVQNTLSVTLEPHSKKDVPVLIDFDGADNAVVTAQFGETVLTQKKIVSFAVARRQDAWEDCPLYDINSFPNGPFPEGVAFNILYLGRLYVGFRVRYSEAGLHVRVEAKHPIHRAFRSDPDGIHCHDGIKIGLKGQAGDRATVIGMALRSDTGEQVCGFNKTAKEKEYPIGQSTVVDFSISRIDQLTTYDVLITWDMINRTGPPKPHTTIPFSIMVSKDDDGENYGLQWFYGIKYDAHEGDESWMGRLWFE